MMKQTAPTYTDIIAKELHALGASYGTVAFWDTKAKREMWTADARGADGRRWIVRAESEVGALMELKGMVQQEKPACPSQG